MLKNHWNKLKICLFGQTTEQPVSYPKFFLAYRGNKSIVSGFILEPEGTVGKIQKRHFFTTEKLKRAPKFSPPLMSIASLKLF